MYKVLVIEDDNMVGEMSTMYLSEEGYSVKRAESGSHGLQMIEQFAPDLVILDIMLPDISGIDLCLELRKRSCVPILAVSMKTEVLDRVDALVAGADDYLCKPFSMRELTARVAALIRRSHMSILNPMPGPAQANIDLDDGEPVKLDYERRAIYVNSSYVDTTYSEFEIMKLFVANKEKVFSRDELINALRGIDSFINDRSIDVHIANLRKKIEQDPKEPKLIKTVWGIGYKYMGNS
ncbi:response regulator transcription factor [Paenibacillus doosanensis]|uniref:Sensory transduction protein regX3 n=1 Tax=Paenibacillus konkukensis TaxID=2020716 RepID=A0ABY4RXP5_9BACL|nr:MULTISPECIES: response regulator transcription factor [Paenibacillus]MCS7458851.1 response regulator transcription factor [Paenibacillus doosanensis]UQZ86620.1 Sensory transduction protein regX3 [Paenibacillus konkukensis]